ncbi:MAG: FtsX-like permease family protein, partial [Cyclobacteriaceae bacterium]
PIGQVIPYSPDDQKSSVIVGVVKDYYNMGLRSDVSPLVLYSDDESRKAISIYLETEVDRNQIDEKLSAAWAKTYETIPVSYEFLKYQRQKILEHESKITKIAGSGSIIAIFIASFGLLGLVGLTLQRKLKEVSVRRILGAGVNNISFLLVRSFFIPIITSLIFGLSIAYFLSNEWLSDYKQRIAFSWLQLTIPSLIVISILVLIIVSQVWRTTSTNPAVHLRDD